MYQKSKKYVHHLLDPTRGNTFLEKFVDRFLITLILTNVLAVILETEIGLFTTYRSIFDAFEKFSIFVFTLEYILRVWSSNVNPKYSHPITGRIKFIFSAESIIDLLAIIPFYLHISRVFDLRFVRIFQLFRFLRLFKLGRYMKATRIVSHVIHSKKEELTISVILTVALVLVSSCLMYFVEHPTQPEKFSSIPATMYWSVTTITTVGYGDVTPITAMGKVLTAFIAILGIGLFALPAGILASAFSDEFRKKNKKEQTCPHCGKEFELHEEHH